MTGESGTIQIPSTAPLLPTDWRWKRLDEICDAVIDCPHSTPVLTADGPFVVRSQDMRTGIFRQEDAGHVSEETYRERIARAEPRYGDLLYSREGTYFGIAAEVPPDVRVCLGQRMVLVRPNATKCNARFLRYWLNSPVMASHTHGHRDGTVAERLNLPTIRQLPVAVPPLREQRAIAHILGTLDDKIELNRRMNETLEAMARALFKSWFVDFDPVRAKAEGRAHQDGARSGQGKKPLNVASDLPRPEAEAGARAKGDPGLPKPLADLFPDSFEDSELGEIPKRWKVGTFGEVAEHPRRSVKPKEIKPTTPYIALEHMPRRCIALSGWEAADGLESNKFEFKKGEILFGKLRPYFHKVGVAPVDGVCSTDIVVVKPRTQDWFGFVLGHNSSDAFVEQTNAGSTGTKMPRTSWGDMARYTVVIPPVNVAKAFTSQIQPLVDHIISAIHESRTIAALRDALLPKLINGALRLPCPELPKERSSV